MWCDPTLVGTGIATENVIVKRAVAMKNRQCLNSMADYVSIANAESRDWRPARQRCFG